MRKTGSGGARYGWPLPLPIAARGRQSIKAILEPADPDLYRRTLPEGMDMPERPELLFEHVKFAPGWHETSVSMACRVAGEAGWHGLYWAIDQRLAYLLGRAIGYPKSMAGRMSLEGEGGTYHGEVVQQGERVCSVELTTEEAAPSDGVPSPSEELPYFMLVPPAEGPSINRVVFRRWLGREVASFAGRLSARFWLDAPWAPLLPEEVNAIPATMHEETGRSLGFLISRRLRR